jgi:hypothetical protein
MAMSSSSAPQASPSGQDTSDLLPLPKVLTQLVQLTSIKLFKSDGEIHAAIYGTPSSSADSWVVNLPASALFLGDPAQLQHERLIAAAAAHQQAPFKPSIAKLLYTPEQRLRQSAKTQWRRAANAAMKEAKQLRKQSDMVASVALISASADALCQAAACSDVLDERQALRSKAYSAFARCSKVAQLEARLAERRGEFGQAHALRVHAAEAQLAAAKLAS